jgi:predicted PurR-regulated permease PerM
MFLKPSFLGLVYLALFFALIKLTPFIITPLFLGLFLATIINIPERMFAKKLSPRWSKILANVLVIGIILYALGNFFPIVINQGRAIFTSLQDIEIYSQGEIELPQWIVDIINNLNQYLSDFALTLLNNVISYTPSALIAAILVIVTTISIGSLKSEISKNIVNLFPVDTEKGISFAKKTFKDFENFVQGQFFVAAFVGLFVGISVYVTGISGGFFLGVLAWVTNFIPYLGVIISAIPLLMLAYSAKGLIGLLIGIIILVLANQIEVWILSPRIQSRSLKLHWFVILVSILLFGQLFSFAGVLIALPSIMYIKNYWDFFVTKKSGIDMQKELVVDTEEEKEEE